MTVADLYSEKRTYTCGDAQGMCIFTGLWWWACTYLGPYSPEILCIATEIKRSLVIDLRNKP